MRNGSPWSSRCLILLARPLRPPREPLPDIEEHEVRLVTWMAVKGTRTEASAAAVSWLFSRWPQWPSEPMALHACGARSGVSPRSRCGAASPPAGLGRSEGEATVGWFAAAGATGSATGQRPPEAMDHRPIAGQLEGRLAPTHRLRVADRGRRVCGSSPSSRRSKGRPPLLAHRREGRRGQG